MPTPTAIQITALSFTPDGGSTLATGTRADSADVWAIDGPTVEKPQLLENGQMEIGLALAISPDGKRLAMLGSDGTLRMAELVNGKFKVRNGDDAVLQIGNSSLNAAVIAFSPNNKYLAASRDESGRVVVCNAGTGKRLRDRQLPVEVRGVAFAPDSRHLAIVTGNGAVVFASVGLSTRQSIPNETRNGEGLSEPRYRPIFAANCSPCSVQSFSATP